MRAVKPRARLIAAAVLWTLCFVGAAGVTASVVHRGLLGADAHAYWLTGRESHLYAHPPESRDAYLYSPVFAQIIWPLAQLPWVWFRATWMVIETAAFAWLLAPLGWIWAPPLLALTSLEVSQGNIWAFIGVAAVLGLRRPHWWTLPLLTKVSIDLGPVWFAVRRDWKSVLNSVWPALLLVAVSVVLSPHQWSDWIRFLREQDSDPVLVFRVVAGIVLAAFAARTGAAWVLPAAMLLAAPVIHGVGFLSLLAAVPRLIHPMRLQRTQPVTISKTVAEP